MKGREKMLMVCSESDSIKHKVQGMSQEGKESKLLFSSKTFKLISKALGD